MIKREAPTTEFLFRKKANLITVEENSSETNLLSSRKITHTSCGGASRTFTEVWEQILNHRKWEKGACEEYEDELYWNTFTVRILVRFLSVLEANPWINLGVIKEEGLLQHKSMICCHSERSLSAERWKKVVAGIISQLELLCSFVIAALVLSLINWNLEASWLMWVS